MKRTELKRRTPLRAKRTRMQPVSAKRQAELEVYYPLRDEFLAANRTCWRCGAPSTCVHHRRGRRGSRLTDVRYFAASCDFCNEWAESHTGEALAEGWLLRVESAA